jgi:hypothetical protein
VGRFEGVSQILCQDAGKRILKEVVPDETLHVQFDHERSPFPDMDGPRKLMMEGAVAETIAESADCSTSKCSHRAAFAQEVPRLAAARLMPARDEFASS